MARRLTWAQWERPSARSLGGLWLAQKTGTPPTGTSACLGLPTKWPCWSCRWCGRTILYRRAPPELVFFPSACAVISSVLILTHYGIRVYTLKGLMNADVRLKADCLRRGQGKQMHWWWSFLSSAPLCHHLFGRVPVRRFFFFWKLHSTVQKEHERMRSFLKGASPSRKQSGTCSFHEKWSLEKKAFPKIFAMYIGAVVVSEVLDSFLIEAVVASSNYGAFHLGPSRHPYLLMN